MVISFIQQLFLSGIDLLNGTSIWLIISFTIAGLLHNFLKPERFQQMLGNTRVSSIVKATISGMFLPICSCGVIPLGMGLYYSGAYLGPTMAFNIATPIINPAAIILAFGLLGPQVATIYLLAGFMIPILVGMIGNALAGPELHLPGMGDSECQAKVLEEEETNIKEKILGGLKWGFGDMGMQVSKFVVPAMFLVGIVFIIMPDGFIQQYLGNPSILSIGGTALLASVMYVCAVGHIPFVAALVASGASPGTAITFLMAGAATNLPELISMYKMLGKRAVAIYSISLFTFALIVGYLTNWLLMPGFVSAYDFARSQQAIGFANHFIFSPPDPLRYLASLIILVMCSKAYWEKLRPWMQEKRLKHEKA